MTANRTRGLALDLLTLATLTLMISGIALVNGFPLVYADTGTYLLSAIDHIVPVDRPYWYGVFLRWTSLGGRTLWGPVLVQALLCSILLLRLCCLHVPEGKRHAIVVIVTAVFALGTGLGWNAGQLMPDIFTSIGVLALLLLWTDHRKIMRTTGYAGLVLLSSWVHSSNLLILSVLAVAMAPVFRNGRLRLREHAGTAMLTVALAWGGLLLLNRSADGEAYLAKGGHVFLMGRLIDAGILPVWLDEHCPEQKFVLCGYRDALPNNSQQFLWDGNSPLQLMGGWQATREEYGRIVRSVLKQPRYLMWYLGDGLRSTLRQLGLWTVGRRLQGSYYREPDSAPYRVIAERSPQHLVAYRGFLQVSSDDAGASRLRSADLRYRITMLVTALMAGVILLTGLRRRLGSSQRLLLLVAFAAVLINCAVCAGLSVADDRFLSRISWLLPLAVVLCITSLWGGPARPDQQENTSTGAQAMSV